MGNENNSELFSATMVLTAYVDEKGNVKYVKSSWDDLFKKEEENIRFNLGEETDYRQCMIGMKEYLDKIKSVYRGKINF